MVFLSYRIYRLENKINNITIKHRNINSGVSDQDGDAQAYLKLLDSKKFKLLKKLDILKAKRYKKNLSTISV